MDFGLGAGLLLAVIGSVYSMIKMIAATNVLWRRIKEDDNSTIFLINLGKLNRDMIFGWVLSLAGVALMFLSLIIYKP